MATEMMSFEQIFDALRRENQSRLDEHRTMIVQLEMYVAHLKARIATLKAMKAMKKALESLMKVA